MKLADYGITRQFGFLGSGDCAEAGLPEEVLCVMAAAGDIPASVSAGKLRSIVDDLPTIDPVAVTDTLPMPARRALLRDLGMLLQAYVWSEPKPPATCPANLAQPFVALADSLGMVPMLTYSGYVLDNWRTSGSNTVPDLHEVQAVRTFTGHEMERWFIAIHVAIEATAGRALGAIADLERAIEEADETGCEHALLEIAAAWHEIGSLLRRMSEGCSAEFFFLRLRPFWHGWLNNDALPDGLIYQGVERFVGLPQRFRGVAGSQSPILRAMDILLGIEHENNQLTRYLAELDMYRPPEQRRFLSELSRRTGLCAYLASPPSGAVRDAVEACRAAIADFRTGHLEFASTYIHNRDAGQPGNRPEIGTGGVEFMRQLRAMRDASRP